MIDANIDGFMKEFDTPITAIPDIPDVNYVSYEYFQEFKSDTYKHLVVLDIQVKSFEFYLNIITIVFIILLVILVLLIL